MYFTALTHDYAYKLKMHTATYHFWKFTDVNQYMNVPQNVVYVKKKKCLIDIKDK